MSVANGQKMLTQIFNLADDKDGMLVPRDRSSRVANLRPVRRIPFVVSCNNYIQSNSSSAQHNWKESMCSSCLDHVEGYCQNE